MDLSQWALQTKESIFSKFQIGFRNFDQKLKRISYIYYLTVLKVGT